MYASEVQRGGADCYYQCGSPWHIAFKSKRLDEIQRECMYIEKEAHQHFGFSRNTFGCKIMILCFCTFN